VVPPVYGQSLKRMLKQHDRGEGEARLVLALAVCEQRCDRMILVELESPATAARRRSE
jgi:hypothetical protein